MPSVILSAEHYNMIVRMLGLGVKVKLRVNVQAQFHTDDKSGHVNGPAPDHASYSSFATFSDPDGNGWLLQEITTRLPGRVEPAETGFVSAADLASALRRAASAHGEHEKRSGQADENWPDWYAAYIVAERAGEELPS